MYKFILVSMLFWGLLPVTNGQIELPENIDTPEERATRLTLEMIDKLHLQDNQLNTIDAINYQYAQIMQTQIFDQNLSVWSQYYRGSKIMSEKDIYVEAQLDKEQTKLYQKMKNDIMYQILGKIF